ncbi:hypothetical protein [Agromyces larvae]|uniref:Sel1 repeat family protein n=1 Tax=Agromyces larvae TaxID=2929802 RepID=A0ABY4C7A8_9MICO|nr:hypothetical protein [Agromyces larvae]UOE45986.1 hypothetical protein MTO99_09655 [Agromyces larvae]
MAAGLYPLDPNTPVGQLRVNVGDTGFTLEDGYANFSDVELEALLAQSSGNIARATGNAYLRLSAIYAAMGRSVKTDDLGLDTKGRGGDLLEVAKEWFARAAEADLAEAQGYFDIVPLASHRNTPFFL